MLHKDTIFNFQNTDVPLKVPTANVLEEFLTAQAANIHQQKRFGVGFIAKIAYLETQYRIPASNAYAIHFKIHVAQPKTCLHWPVKHDIAQP